MARKHTEKRYKLGSNISFRDANKILGLQAKKTLSWREFQEYAERNNLGIKQKKILKEEQLSVKGE